MAYHDLVPDAREALAVTSAKDQLVLDGLKRNAKYLLRNYNFPEAITKVTTSTLASGATGFALASGVGKIKAVRMKLTSDTPPLYVSLKRREEDIRPSEGGPQFWHRVGDNLVFDTALVPGAGETYVAEYWYQTVSITTAETWLSDTYSDVLLHRSVYEMSLQFRKPETQQTYGMLWQEDMQVLAVYLNELEFNGLDMRMWGEEVTIQTERYAAN